MLFSGAMLKGLSSINFIRLTPRHFGGSLHALSRQPSSIPTLSTGDSRATNDYDKANCLNNQFYNNFNFSHAPLNTVPPLAHSNPEHCPDDFLCTEDEVFGLILGLDNRKSTGPDEISAKMLGGTIFSIVPRFDKAFQPFNANLLLPLTSGNMQACVCYS